VVSFEHRHRPEQVQLKNPAKKPVTGKTIPTTWETIFMGRMSQRMEKLRGIKGWKMIGYLGGEDP